MRLTDRAFRPSGREGRFASLRQVYFRMTPVDVPADLRRSLSRLDEAGSRAGSRTQLAIVAQGDSGGRALAAALLSETDLDVVECASAEAALAVLAREADRTRFLLADENLAGERDVHSLTAAVRLLWPGVHVAVASLGPEDTRRVEPDGIIRLSRPWRGLDVLIEARCTPSRAA